MGRDKALIPVDGVPMARRVADALLAAGCDQVVAIGGDAEALAAIGLDVVHDELPGEGPVGGVLTALHALPDAEAVVVLACDLPWISSASIGLLVAAATTEGTLVAVARTDRLQPMCAAWRPESMGAIESAVASGERRLHAVIAELPSVEVRLPIGDLLNVNAPGDLPSSL
jgi:molybdopterin-guanine dinucleotide biosynthesis protein A